MNKTQNKMRFNIEAMTPGILWMSINQLGG